MNICVNAKTLPDKKKQSTCQVLLYGNELVCIKYKRLCLIMNAEYVFRTKFKPCPVLMLCRRVAIN